MKALEEHGISPSAIAGSSSGAVLGALFAAGHGADKVYEIAKSVNYTSFFTSTVTGGLIGHEGLEAMLKDNVPETFEELKIPLATTAVDIQDGELLVMRQGPLIPCACASNAFPGLFGPLRHKDRYLMDGGILNNFPVDIIRSLTNDQVMAFDVTLSDKVPIDFEGEEKPSVFERIKSTIKGEGLPTPMLVNILMKAYVITQTRLIKMTTTMYPPDFLIRQPLPDDYGIESFGRLEEGYKIGYDTTHQYLLAKGL
jgi:NTE family protein